MKINVKEFKSYLKGEKNLMVESLSVGTLKKQILERRDKAMLGHGFKQDDVTTSDDKESPMKRDKRDKARKITQKGSTMLGQGFKMTESMLKKMNLSTEGLVDLVEQIVKSLKGKNDYTNLRFVDKIGKKYRMNESSIKNIKKIIRSENSLKTGRKLFNYITECSCGDSQDSYQQYSGLQQPVSSILPQVKQGFNSYRQEMPTSQAIKSTSLNLNIPFEMVQEIYEIQKKSAKLKMEGGYNPKLNEDMQAVIERYQKMSEGNVYEMYDEMAEMMDYPSSDNQLEYDDDSYQERYDDELDYENDPYGMGYNEEEHRADSYYHLYDDEMTYNKQFENQEFDDYDYDDDSYQEIYDDELDYENDPYGMGYDEEEHRADSEYHLYDDEMTYNNQFENQDFDDYDYDDDFYQEKYDNELDYENDPYGMEYNEEEHRADSYYHLYDDEMTYNKQFENQEFDDVYNKMESYMNENLGDSGDSPIIEMSAVNPETNIEEEYEVFKTEEGYYQVNGNTPQSDFRVWVKNGTVTNGRYIPKKVRLAILQDAMGNNDMINSEFD